jgi:hypothetical protein
MAQKIRALTISQPYATLIAIGEKFVENRTWECFHRGPLLIHAGKGTQYLTARMMKQRNLPTGCIVAACRMIACVHVPSLKDRIVGQVPYRDLPIEQMKQVAAHRHTEGPFAFVLSEVRRLKKPIPCSGAQGLWIPTVEVIAEVEQQLDKQIW